MGTSEVSNVEPLSLALSRKQRSHILLILSNPSPKNDSAFLSWYRERYRQALLNVPGVLSVRHYEQHSVDITQGRYPRIPFRYLGLCDISVDGAEAAVPIIKRVFRLHSDGAAADLPATWLYYPASEKIGRTATDADSLITLAFANGLEGKEAEFREWYATRHIRHALNVPVFVSGQCLERTQFQMAGASDAIFSTVAIYEQEGTPEMAIRSFENIPESTFHFPSLDVAQFSESVYQPVG